MANKIIHMTKIRQILRLYTQGESKRKISELTGIARNTLKKYVSQYIRNRLTLDAVNAMNDHELELFFAANIEPPKEKRFEDLQPLLPVYEKELKRRGVTMTSVWKQYRQIYPDGYELTQFYKYLRQYCKRFRPVMHMEHKAGDKMYIDFAGEKMNITDKESGEVISVEVFAAILGCSQLMYAEAVASQKKEDLIRACENAL